MPNFFDQFDTVADTADALGDTVPSVRNPNPTPTPYTTYALGKSVGGPDEYEDGTPNNPGTNQGYGATGHPILSPSIVAVNTTKYPLGSILRNKDTGYVYLAADKHGNKNPDVIDFYKSPEDYKKEAGTANIEVVGMVDTIPDTVEGVNKLLAPYGKVPEGPSALESLGKSAKKEANFFDQFDTPPEKGNFFDQFDGPKAQPSVTPEVITSPTPTPIEGGHPVDQPDMSNVGVTTLPTEDLSGSDKPVGTPINLPATPTPTPAVASPATPVQEQQTPPPTAEPSLDVLPKEQLPPESPSIVPKAPVAGSLGLNEIPQYESLKDVAPEKHNSFLDGFFDAAGSAIGKSGAGIAQMVGASPGAKALGIDQNLKFFGKDFTQAFDQIQQEGQANGAGYQVGSGIGTGLALLAGGIQGAITQVAGQAFGETYSQTGDAGQASISAIKAAPEMLAYWLVGGLAGEAIAPLLKSATPLGKSIATGLVATIANATTSAGIRYVEGQPLQPTIAGTTQDALFGLVLHGIGTGFKAAQTEAGVKDGLAKQSTEALQLAASDPQFRATSPYRPALIDQELAKRAGKPIVLPPSNDPEVAAKQAEIEAKANEQYAPKPQRTKTWIARAVANRLAELRVKRDGRPAEENQGTPNVIGVGPDGRPIFEQGAEPPKAGWVDNGRRILSPEEKAELEFLEANQDNPEAIANQYGYGIKEPITTQSSETKAEPAPPVEQPTTPASPEAPKSNLIKSETIEVQSPGSRITAPDGKRGEIVKESEFGGVKTWTVEWADGSTSEVMADLPGFKRSKTNSQIHKNRVVVSGSPTDAQGNTWMVKHWDGDGNRTAHMAATEKEANEIAASLVKDNNLEGYEANDKSFVPNSSEKLSESDKPLEAPVTPPEVAEPSQEVKTPATAPIEAKNAERERQRELNKQTRELRAKELAAQDAEKNAYIPPKSSNDLPDAEQAKEITWYHGTGAKGLNADSISSTFTKIESLFGSGFYLTDKPEVAGQYANRKGKEGGEVYAVKVAPRNVLNFDKPLPPDAIAALKKHAYGGAEEAIDEALTKPGATGSDVWKAITKAVEEDSHDNNSPISEYAELFQGFEGNLRDAGYDAITHLGGVRKGNGELHRVLIVLDPQDEYSAAGAKRTFNPITEVTAREKAATPPSLSEPDKSGTAVTGGDTEQPLPDLKNDWTTSTEGGIEPENKNQQMGLVPPGIPELMKAYDHLKTVAKAVKGFVYDLPKVSDFKTALLRWVGKNQWSTQEITKAERQIRKAVPNKARREGITNWVQANGDEAVLRDRLAATTKSDLKRGYEAALNLTPEEKAMAGKIKDTYDILLARAKKYGIDLNARDNYVNQIWDRGVLGGITTSSGRLNNSFRFGKQRVFDSFFDGEQAGYKPKTKDIGKLLPIYMNELNNAINSRVFVEAMSKGRASDGRPLLAPRGAVATVDNPAGKAHLVFPDTANKDTQDYRVLDQQALHSWQWKGEDTEGNPIMVKGDLAVHPEVYDHLRKVLGETPPAPSSNMAVRAAQEAFKALQTTQSYAKGTMLSLSPFHMVQEGIHAIGHRINPFAVPEIDLNKPEQMDAANHGLMLAHDRVSQSMFMEGLGSGDRNLLTKGMRLAGGKIGEKGADAIDSYNHFLFEKYIPGLKFKTYQAMVKRNMGVYAKDLASGKVTEGQVKELSARQANYAYGHLNYAAMGRSKIARSINQLLFLAPDFLEARAKFAGQAMRGAVGSKNGREQLLALGFLAMTQYVAARIGNKLDHDDYDFDHPFEIRHGNRYYGLRSVPEDMYKLAKDRRAFIYGRISPIFSRGILEGLTGINYRGEKTDATDTIKSMVANTVPLPLQAFTRPLTATTRNNSISPFEQILQSTGIQVKRYSPINDTYQLASEWVKKNEPDKSQKGTYPTSQYAPLKYALEDGDTDKAKAEVQKLKDAGLSAGKIESGMRASVDHAFTGSAAGDKKFVASLDEDQKKTYQAAVARRKLILQRFYQLRKQ